MTYGDENRPGKRRRSSRVLLLVFIVIGVFCFRHPIAEFLLSLDSVSDTASNETRVADQSEKNDGPTPSTVKKQTSQNDDKKNKNKPTPTPTLTSEPTVTSTPVPTGTLTSEPTVTSTPVPTGTLTSTNSEAQSAKSYVDDRVPTITWDNVDLDNCEWINYEMESYDRQYVYSMVIPIYEDIYWHYHCRERYYQPYDYINYIADPFNKEYIEYVVDYFQDLFGDVYSESEMTREILHFVQEIYYCYDEESVGKGEWPKYPIETLYEKEGDCEDTAILLAALYRQMGYSCVLLVYDTHVAVGLRAEGLYGSYYEYNSGHYYYVETTGSGWEIGQVPDEYRNASATIVPVS